METFPSFRSTLLLNFAKVVVPRETVPDRILLEGGSSNDALKIRVVPVLRLECNTAQKHIINTNLPGALSTLGSVLEVGKFVSVERRG